MHPHIFGFGIAIFRALGIDEALAVSVIGVGIDTLSAGAVGIEKSVVLTLSVTNAVNTRTGIIDGVGIEVAIFIAALEDEGGLIDPFEFIRFPIGRCGSIDEVIPAVILLHGNEILIVARIGRESDG